MNTELIVLGIIGLVLFILAIVILNFGLVWVKAYVQRALWRCCAQAFRRPSQVGIHSIQGIHCGRLVPNPRRNGRQW